jgi:enediyne biosynthesis protein E4
MTTDAHRRCRFLLGCATLGLVSMLASSAAPKPEPIVLVDVTAKTRIAFKHNDGGSGRRYIVEYVSAGLALFDYDNDGDEDIYFLNGAPLPGTKVKIPPKNALYRNDGDFKFTDVTEKARVGDTGHGLGVAVGDYDNDGDLDLYLNNYGPNVLYQNNGDGAFTNVTEKAGVANGKKVGAGANFLDIDKDGDLDLFVSNYVKFSPEAHTVHKRRGFSAYPSPMEYAGDPDTLYRNNGDGTFTDVSRESGIANHAGHGMGTVCGDFDNDGDTDIFVCNDVSANFLYINDGAGKFKETGLSAGVAYDVDANAQGSMAAVCGDYDNDGRLDIYATSYQKELATLYRNLGKGLFEDRTLATGSGAGTASQVTWGAGLIDIDNDGDRDIFVACGHLDDNIEKVDDTTNYLARNILLMNTGAGKFVNVSSRAGDGLAVKLSSRGAVFGDLDNDGDLDAVILNSRRGPTILRNDSPTKNHWLQVRLRGVKSNRDGVGARVKVVTGKLTQIDEVRSGRGYQSHYGMRLHFGLGKLDRIDRVEVSWIGGGRDVLKNVRVDQVLKITEGSSKTKP